MSPNPTDNPLTPASVEELRDHVQAANASGDALEVVGGGSKRFYGRPVQASRTLSVAGLDQVVDYLPHELLLVAQPGIPLVTVERLLAGKGQMLAFEPPHWGEGATLGGVLACNLSGPRRIKMGAARDHLLGFQAVTGRGEIIRGGGRVVKNVTGYDLSKLICGSFGTLAVMSEVCVKVLPRPETERTVVVPGLDDEQALRLMIDASRSSHDVSGLVHLPADTELPVMVTSLVGAGEGLTALRVEGPGPSVVYRSERLIELTGHQTVFLDAEDSHTFWSAVRELKPLSPGDDEHLWRISIPPAHAVVVARSLRRLGESRLYYDWGGGLVWAVLPGNTQPRNIGSIAREAGGHAEFLRDGGNSGMERASFVELSTGQHRMTLGLKMAFDPNRILNPGRLHPDL